LTITYISLMVKILQFSFSLSYTGPKILLYTSFQKCLFAFYLSLLVSRFLMHMLKVLSIIVFFSLNFGFLYIFLFQKNFCSMEYVLLAFFVLSCKSIWFNPWL
jgi:hypothetical protein